MDFLSQTLGGSDAGLPDFTVGATLTALLLAFVLGQLVAWVYCWTHHGLSYSRSFTQSLVVITMLVSLVMFVIGNSIVAAFGLLGALAIIRFRNVLKDTRDTVFIFLSLILGMACGTQHYVTAVLGAVVMLLVMAYLSWTSFGSFGRYDGYLSLRVAGDAAGESAFGPVLNGFCTSMKQVSLRAGGPDDEAEFVYEIGLRDRARTPQLLAALRGLDGVRDASLVLRDELAEV